MAKLTLYVDDELVQRAKAYAKAHQTSVSKLVTQYLASLAGAAQEDLLEQLHAKLLAQGLQEPTEEELDASRREYLARKYQ
jgi:hypothetical protein